MSLRKHRHHTSQWRGGRELSYALALTVGVMVIELVAGLLSGSLALLADAGHMLTDSFALGFSLFAAWIAARPATLAKTYGYYRTEILAALLNGVVLWLLVIWIYLRAIERLHATLHVHTAPMLVAAGLGLVANLTSSWILFGAQQHNLNVRGAWLHVLGDALGSLGVIVAGVIIRWKGWMIADPIVSMFIGLLIAISSWVLLKQSINILLESAPVHLDVGRMTRAMCAIRGVRAVHDLHLWTITTGMDAMSGHVVIEGVEKGPAILSRLNQLLAKEFGIEHTTLQLEPVQQTCEPADSHHA